MYGNSTDFYEIRSFPIDEGVIWNSQTIPISHIFPIYGFHFSFHTIPTSHINPIYGNRMDFYEIRIFPIEKTMESQDKQRYVFHMQGKVPYQNHVTPTYGP